MARSTHRSRSLAVLVVTLLVSLGGAALWQGAVGTESQGIGEAAGPWNVEGSAVAGAAGAGASASGASPFPRGIVVVGDSITARYDDHPGSPVQGWWSMVGRHFGSQVRTYAQSGSGYQRPGLRCGGNRFIDRPEAFSGPAPSVFIVEGGRNDWATCHEGRFVESTDAAVARAVDRYLGVLRRQLPRSTRIVVLGPPWGPLDPWQQRRITSIVHTAATRHGLEYVPTGGTLDRPGRTVDGVHPTLAGSRALAGVVIAALEGSARA